MADLEVENWIALIGNAPGWLALVVSIISAIFAYKSYSLNKRKDDRTAPSLELYLTDCYMRVSPDKVRFYFDVLVTNRSDTANSVCEVELILKFVQPNGIELSRRLRATGKARDDLTLLAVGFRLNPWEAKRGFCEFELQLDEESKLHRLPAVKLEIADSTGAAYSVSTEVISERSL